MEISGKIDKEKKKKENDMQIDKIQNEKGKSYNHTEIETKRKLKQLYSSYFEIQCEIYTYLKKYKRAQNWKKWKIE